MTAETGAQHIAVIDPVDGLPPGDAVTALADIGRLDMRAAFACCRHPVVTTRAVACDAGMVIGTGAPGNGVVAVIAGSAIGGKVRCRHTGRDGAVVTADAGTDDCGVVYPANPVPTECGVTKFATVIGEDMGGILAHRRAAVMAIGAIAGDVAVIETRIAPSGDGVAVIALIAALYMVG